MYEENRAPEEEMILERSKKRSKPPSRGRRINPHTMEIEKRKRRRDQRKRPCANDCVESSQRRTDVNAPKKPMTHNTL